MITLVSVSEAWDALERGVARGPHVERPSPREIDVLRCLSYGMTEEMAADALGITYATVHEHMERVRRKLAAKNAAHAVAKAFRNGWLS